MNEPERKSLIQGLGLDRRHLEEVADRTHQWGKALENLLEQDRPVGAEESAPPSRSPAVLRSEAASLFTIAGSYRMLLEPSLARQSMLSAARHFGELGNTFSYPLAVCAEAPEIALRSLEDLQPTLSARDRSNVLLVLSWIDVTSDRSSRSGASFARNLLHRHLDLASPDAENTIGRMRIPLGAVASVVRAADEVAHEDGAPARLSNSLHDALIRMHDVTAAAMADQYHWRRLMSSVLPVEPEAAVLAGVALAAATRTDSVPALLEQADLPLSMLAPLRIGEEMAKRAL